MPPSCIMYRHHFHAASSYVISQAFIKQHQSNKTDCITQHFLEILCCKKELSKKLFEKVYIRVRTWPKKLLQRGIHSYLIQQVHLIVCWPLYKRIRKECHWRVRYLTRLGSGLYGGGGLQWEADTIV